MKIKKCRSCEEKNLEFLFSLGKMSFTGKFADNYVKSIPSDINLIFGTISNRQCA